MSDITDNGTTDSKVDGYVSPNARNTNVPLLGHMVTYRFQEPERGAASSSYQEMVNQAKELGLTNKHVPPPRFGRNAFKIARNSFKTSPFWQTTTLDDGINWDNMRCRARYECHRMISDYVIQRIRTGTVDGREYTQTTPLYRVRYTAGSGDANARAYHKAYVKSVWEGDEALSDSERALLNPQEGEEVRDGTEYIELEPYELGGQIHDIQYYTEAYSLIRQRYKQICQEVDAREFRRTVRNLLIKDFNAIPMTAVRGAVLVPDTRTEEEIVNEKGVRTPPAYLDELDAINSLMYWYGEVAEDVSVIQMDNEVIPGVEVEESSQMTSEPSLADQVQALHKAKCQMTIMCYINDTKQMETLQTEMQKELNKQLTDYLKQFEKQMNQVNTNDDDAIDRAVESLRRARSKFNQTAEFYCGSGYMDGVNIQANETLTSFGMGLRTRLGSLGMSNNKTAQLRELLNFDEADVGLEEEE